MELKTEVRRGGVWGIEKKKYRAERMGARRGERVSAMLLKEGFRKLY